VIRAAEPDVSGYLDRDGTRIYYEAYGRGDPIVRGMNAGRRRRCYGVLPARQAPGPYRVRVVRAQTAVRG
jgi:hypothetical protein